MNDQKRKLQGFDFHGHHQGIVPMIIDIKLFISFLPYNVRATNKYHYKKVRANLIYKTDDNLYYVECSKSLTYIINEHKLCVHIIDCFGKKVKKSFCGFVSCARNEQPYEVRKHNAH